MIDPYDDIHFHLGQSIIIREIADYQTFGSRVLKKHVQNSQSGPISMQSPDFIWTIVTFHFIVGLP